jgi:hypothetical protein
MRDEYLLREVTVKGTVPRRHPSQAHDPSILSPATLPHPCSPPIHFKPSNLRNRVLKREPSTNAERTLDKVYDACETLEDVLEAKHDDNRVKTNLGHVCVSVHDTII